MTPTDVTSLDQGKATLTLLMNEKGGINDDCIVTKIDENSYYVVLNAGCKDKDLQHLNYYKNLGDWKNKDIAIIYNEDNSLIAV